MPRPPLSNARTLSAVLCVKSQLLNNKTIVYVVSVCLTDMVVPNVRGIFVSRKGRYQNSKKKITKSGQDLRLGDNASSDVAPSESS